MQLGSVVPGDNVVAATTDQLSDVKVDDDEPPLLLRPVQL